MPACFFSFVLLSIFLNSHPFTSFVRVHTPRLLFPFKKKWQKREEKNKKKEKNKKNENTSHEDEWVPHHVNARYQLDSKLKTPTTPITLTLRNVRRKMSRKELWLNSIQIKTWIKIKALNLFYLLLEILLPLPLPLPLRFRIGH